MPDVYTVEDALAFLKNSSLPTLMTEGSDDYRVLRKIERNLADLGIDFLPLGGKGMVLEVWEKLPSARQSSTLALVDLDCWLYHGNPSEYRSPNLIYTKGYSIENDIALDYDYLSLMDANEIARFQNELASIASHHARQIELETRKNRSLVA